MMTFAILARANCSEVVMLMVEYLHQSRQDGTIKMSCILIVFVAHQADGTQTITIQHYEAIRAFVCVCVRARARDSFDIHGLDICVRHLGVRLM